MSVEFDWGVACDAELVNAAALGDRTAFAGIYDRYADRLHDYCLGIVGDRDAADCVQEAFCVAVTDLPSLREPDKLRPWLYAIARNQAFRTLRDRRREMTSDDLPDIPSQAAGPETLVRRNELTDLIATAEGGLSDRDREVLDLAYRHGLSGAELAQALGVGDDAAKKMVQRLRATVERSVGALLIARQARSGYNRCPELAALVADWDGEFTILVRKRVSRHVDSCANCDEARGRLVSPLSLLGAAPLLIPAPSWLRESTLNQMQHAPLGAGVVGAATHAAGHGVGRFAAWVIALFAVPVATVGVAVSLTAPHDSPGTSVQFSSVPTTSVTASATNVAPLQPSTSTPPPVGPSRPGPSAGNQSIQPTAPVPSLAPSTTVVQQAPPAPSRTQAAPAPSAPASTAAPRSREPKKPPVMETPKPTTTTTTQAPQPPCPRIAVDNGPICGRPTP